MSLPPGPMVHFRSMWRWAFGRYAERNALSLPEKFTISAAQQHREVVSWLRFRGYQAVPGTAPGVMGGIVFAKKNQPAYVAMVGDVLVWDGTNVRIED